jgi:hypothetical protein
MAEKFERPALHIPELRSRAETEHEINSTDPDRVHYGLIDSSYHEDAAWVQERCLERLNSTNALVRSGALMALQILTAVRREIDPTVVVPAVEILRHDPDSRVAESATDVLQDIKNFYRQSSADGR